MNQVMEQLLYIRMAIHTNQNILACLLNINELEKNKLILGSYSILHWMHALPFAIGHCQQQQIQLIQTDYPFPFRQEGASEAAHFPELTSEWRI